MNDKLYYCKKCGMLKQMFECADYDENTGKKIWRQYCPNEKCEEHCWAFSHEYKNRSWFGYEAECKKCGYIPSDY